MRLVVVSVAVCACADEPSPQLPPAHAQYVISNYLRGLPTGSGIGGGLVFLMSVLNREASPEPSVNTFLEHGSVITLLDVRYADLGDHNEPVAAIVLHGADPSPAPCFEDNEMLCGRHLQGGAHFTAISDGNPVFEGLTTFSGSRLGADTLHVAVPIFGEVVEVDFIGARLSLTRFEYPPIRGAMGGGLRPSEIHAKFFPLIAARINRVIAEQCTSLNDPDACGCAYTGRDFDVRFIRSMADWNPKDCFITSEELIGSNLEHYFLQPDVLIDEEYFASFGFGFEIVPATF